MNIRELRGSRQKTLVYALVLIPFILFLYILILPLGTSVYYSMCSWKGVGEPKFILLDNYSKLMKDRNFWLVVSNTLFYSLYCTIGQVGIALLVSLLLTGKTLLLRSFHRAVIFFPVVMAPVVVGFVWRIAYNADYGFSVNDWVISFISGSVSRVDIWRILSCRIVSAIRASKSVLKRAATAGSMCCRSVRANAAEYWRAHSSL